MQFYRRLQPFLLSHDSNCFSKIIYFLPSQKLNNTKQVDIKFRTLSSSISNDLCKIPHLAFNLPKAHSIWLRVEHID